VTMRHKLTHDGIQHGYGAFCGWIVFEPEAVETGTGIASVKNSVGKPVSEIVPPLSHKRHIRCESPVPRWTFAVWERIQPGDVDQLAALCMGNSSSSSARLVPCVFTAKRVMTGS